MADQRELAETFITKLKASPFVMLGLESGGHSEPLTAQIDDDQSNVLYFFVAKDNRAAGGGAAMAQFVSKGHDFFACLAGTVTQNNDRAMIDKLWSNHVEAWFPGGKDDANLALLRFDIASAELWETDISLAGRVKMLFGGKITASDDSSHAKVEKIG
jgi:general stress protein 26